MEKYFLFINSASDFLLLPAKNFIGVQAASTTVIDLLFEGRPLSYKVPLTVAIHTGPKIAEELAELLISSPDNILIFDDAGSEYVISGVTAVGAFSKISTKR